MGVLSLDHRAAVILRGPNGVGKTEVAKLLLRRFGTPTESLVNLDYGWSPGEYRYNGGPPRYQDLRNNTNTLMVIELAGGEPGDLNFPGATTGAQEWIQVLRRAGRKLHPFLLWAEWPVIEPRLRSRNRGGGVNPLFLMYQRYQFDSYSAPNGLLASVPSLDEQRINTGEMLPEDIASEIATRISTNC